MNISEIGEFGLVRALSELVESSHKSRGNSWNSIDTGIGDDTAIYRAQGTLQLATTDSMIEHVHFDLNYTDWISLGWKAVAVNISDIAAMGGIPDYALVSLGMPGSLEYNSVIDLYKGILEAADTYGVAVIGGNITAAASVSITITVLGHLEESNALKRSSARQGDSIAVTGYTGMSAAGLQMLTGKTEVAAEHATLFRNAHLRPNPRVSEGQLLLKNGVRTAIDISDGLIADLGHICEASGVSAAVSLDKIPVHPGLKHYFSNKYIGMALAGGEDYELLFTGSREKIIKIVRSCQTKVTVIGEILEDDPRKVRVVDKLGNDVELPGSGWDHYRKGQ